MGILNSDCLWATHYRFLNDATERQGALDFFLAIDQMASKDQHISSRYWCGLRESLDRLLQSVDAYFISFTKDTAEPQSAGDRLSQWRGYAPGRQGYSMEFQADSLGYKAGEWTENMRLATVMLQCIYDNEVKEEIAEKVIKGHAEALKLIAQERIKKDHPGSERLIDDPNYSNKLRDLQLNLLKFTSQFKHYGFREENECRLAVYVIQGVSELKLIKFRDGALGRTPYIEIPLGLRDQDSMLKRIIVGPSQDKDQIVVSLRLDLAKMGIQGVKVVPSKIPYRNW